MYIYKNNEVMKTQIRLGVFETNSSSTHSMQIAFTPQDNVDEIVQGIIDRAYEDMQTDYLMKIHEYIQDGVLFLDGVETPYCEENTVEIFIYKTLISKIQYLFSDLTNNIEGKHTYYDNSVIQRIIETSKPYQYFTEVILDYLKKYHPEFGVKEIKLNKDAYLDGTRSDENIFTKEDVEDKEKMRKKVFKILNDQCQIIDNERSYHPYYGPIVKTF